jgi:uncharacterized protein with GYD domain
MRRASACAVTSLLLPLSVLAMLPENAIGQQTGPASHKYFFSATFTVDGIKNLQKQSATGFKAGVAKFFGSVGGRLESWYFDYAENTAYGFVDYPDEIAAATAQAAVNAAGFARVIYKPVLSAEDADKALVKSVATRPPQQQ